jgi:hypothetical protein
MANQQILQWAAQHNYPAIQFVGVSPVKLYPVQGLPPATRLLKYAIGIDGCKDNKMFWETAICLASSDMINGLSNYIESLESASC